MKAVARRKPLRASSPPKQSKASELGSGTADETAISVCDQGTGLTPEQLQCVFEPYFTTKADGWGMGLSISQTIIEAHVGRLWAVPNDDRGMTFYFTLPNASATIEV